jgi:hypothetical protein
MFIVAAGVSFKKKMFIVAAGVSFLGGGLFLYDNYKRNVDKKDALCYNKSK